MVVLMGVQTIELVNFLKIVSTTNNTVTGLLWGESVEGKVSSVLIGMTINIETTAKYPQSKKNILEVH